MQDCFWGWLPLERGCYGAPEVIDAACFAFWQLALLLIIPCANGNDTASKHAANCAPFFNSAYFFFELFDCIVCYP
ncbi:MAG: hypothetical protein HY221_02040 [Candidatus Sungbacteria bacterium]|uniref:Uncharacterized protein n=1 Tax=Candidatus Sungiibacteriota bacterium TaxID=2750080 RepID=A0A932VRB2_9BACT|nr:hypothetical protein [Candidatus Sungbacteria bacterium]